MKKILFLLSLCAAFAVHAEEERLVDKTERTIKKGGEATQSGIEKGASAANKGVTKAFEVVNDKVFKPADGWIQDKVNKKGDPKSTDK
jgi:hypothetical protein